MQRSTIIKILTFVLLQTTVSLVSADVIRDGSIGPGNTSIQPLQPAPGQFEIPQAQGQLSGTNLFHSFSEFNLTNTQSARFTTINPVTNIISRITDTAPSSIDGNIISATPGASLYLINPRGFVFGPNAQLNVAGAFYVSSADTLEYAGGQQLFDARPSAGPPLLLAASPEQFGLLHSASGNIDFSGSKFVTVNDITLHARNITLRQNTALDSILESVQPSGEINLHARENITLNDARLESKKDISLTAADIDLSNNARIRTRTFNTTGANIRLNATGTISISDYVTRTDVPGHAVLNTDTRVFAGQAGISGDIVLNAGVVSIKNGAQLTTSSADNSISKSGDIRINATQRVEIIGKHPDAGFANSESQLRTASGKGASGGSGNITINANDIVVAAGARVLANTAGSGNAGDIRLEANNTLTLDDTGTANKHVIDTDIGADVTGNAGDINLIGSLIELKNNARISSRTQGLGNGGDISLNAAQKILLEGTRLNGGTINATAEGIGAAGNAGNINITAPIVELNKGAKINSSAAGANNGGDITITAADYLSLAGINVVGRNAELSAESATGSSGATGNINIVAGDVRNNAGIISTTTGGSSTGGDINISATGTLALNNNAQINSTSQRSGDAGNINISAAGDVSINSSRIATQSRQAGGGNISIQSDRLIHLQRSTIITDVTSGAGNGGDITLQANFILSDDSNLLARADSGSGGAILIQADNYYETATSTLDASAGTNGTDGSVEIAALNVEVDDKLLPIETNFVDVASLLRPSCTVLAGHKQDDSHLQIKHYSGLPLSPDALLLATDSLGLHSSSNTQAGLLLQHGQQALFSGDFQQARQYLQQAGTQSREQGSAEISVSATLALAQTQQALGEYTLSLQTLSALLPAVKQGNDISLTTLVLNDLGNAYVALGRYAQAQKTLKQAYHYARRSGSAQLNALVLNNLGNLQVATQRQQEALATYQASADYSRVAAIALQEARALANKASTALQLQQTDQAVNLLAIAMQRIARADNGHNKIYILMHIANSYQELAALDKSRYEQGILSAAKNYMLAVDLSKKTANDYTRSFALGRLGELYLLENRFDEALYLTRQALNFAEHGRAAELLYRWYRLQGRLLWAKGNADGAVHAYRRAVEIVEQSRQQVLLRYGRSPQYFNQVVAPIYRDLVDIVLQTSQRVSHKQVAQQLLAEARDTIEKFKAAELRDYFRNECFMEYQAKATRLEQVSASAAVIYPILLPQRLVLLASIGGDIKYYETAVSQLELNQTIYQLRFQLEGLADKQRYNILAGQLYKWLVQPYKDELIDKNIDTLVFVPDGALRTIPLSALYDGKDYIIRHYNVVSSLGLSLPEPRALDVQHASVLLAGLSEATQGFSPLPSVVDELQSIAAMFDSQLLLNRNFTLKDFNTALEQPISIVHIASHAKFKRDVEDSFLLTFDNRLSIRELNEILLKTKYRHKPLELLFLSACQTAADDDRAALGLAGAGIRAGARSAIGSLWDISDAGAKKIVAEFYTQLKKNNQSKARALRQAQLSLLQDQQYSHPFYWSSFILINNWL